MRKVELDLLSHLWKRNQQMLQVLSFLPTFRSWSLPPADCYTLAVCPHVPLFKPLSPPARRRPSQKPQRRWERSHAQHGHHSGGCVHLPADYDGLPGHQVPPLSLPITQVGFRRKQSCSSNPVEIIFTTSTFPVSAASSRRSSDQLDLMVDGLPVSLPSYEEAVYGSWGQRIPACSAPGPTQLLLAQGAAAAGCPQSSSSRPLSDGSQRPLLSGQSPDNPPPPYEEVPRPPSLADDKET